MSKSEEFVKGVWRQEPLIHTPQELTHLAKNLTSDSHPEFGTGSPIGTNELGYLAGDKDSASGECDTACRMVHDYLPHGSHIKEYRKGYDQNTPHVFGNHFVHHVPTTEGMYVVDYTHRQFNANAKFPVVEPQDKFEARKSMRHYPKSIDTDVRTL
jgi:hypothetical protein